MMANSKRSHRRGVATVEAAIIISTLLILLIGILDIGIATYRYNLLAEAARHLTREAIVHGTNASPELPSWGPTAVNGNAGDNSAVANVIQPRLAGFDLSQVTIDIEWIDGSNEPDNRVRVELGYRHTPLALLNLGDIQLHAVSTMRIVH